LDAARLEQLRAHLDEPDWNLESAREFLSDKSNYLIVAKIAERVVGALIAHRLARLDSQRAQMLLYEIDVQPDFQGKGVGSAMIERLKELAREAGSCEVWVVTNKSNEAATRLYRATGGFAKQDDDVVFEYKL